MPSRSGGGEAPEAAGPTFSIQLAKSWLLGRPSPHCFPTQVSTGSPFVRNSDLPPSAACSRGPRTAFPESLALNQKPDATELLGGRDGPIPCVGSGLPKCWGTDLLSGLPLYSATAWAEGRARLSCCCRLTRLTVWSTHTNGLTSKGNGSCLVFYCF